MKRQIEQNWNNATWSGSRRAMIRLALKMTVRERLQALEELNNTSMKLVSLKKTQNNRP